MSNWQPLRLPVFVGSLTSAFQPEVPVCVQYCVRESLHKVKCLFGVIPSQIHESKYNHKNTEFNTHQLMKGSSGLTSGLQD